MPSRPGPGPRLLIAALLFIPLVAVESHAGRAKRQAASEPPEAISGRSTNQVSSHEAQSPHTISPTADTSRKVVDLPEDAERWWTTLILDVKWQSFPNQVKARSMMIDDKACAELMQQTSGRIITIDTPIAKPYFKYMSGTPCLVVQNPDGQVIYSEVNPDLGRRPRELIAEINKTMKRKQHCDGNVCPVVEPILPKKTVVDDGPKDVPIVPAVSPAPPATPAKTSSILPAILAFLVLGGLAYAARFGIAARRSS